MTKAEKKEDQKKQSENNNISKENENWKILCIKKGHKERVNFFGRDGI